MRCTQDCPSAVDDDGTKCVGAGWAAEGTQVYDSILRVMWSLGRFMRCDVVPNRKNCQQRRKSGYYNSHLLLYFMSFSFQFVVEVMLSTRSPRFAARLFVYVVNCAMTKWTARVRKTSAQSHKRLGG